MGLFGGFGSGNEKQERKMPTSAMLFLRLAIGGYLLYLAYQLFVDRATGSIALPVLIPILIVFTVAGLIIVVISLGDLTKGRYQGGHGEIYETEDDAVKEAVDGTLVQETAEDNAANTTIEASVVQELLEESEVHDAGKTSAE